ncbi:MAG: fused MFS/spermidine synthase [Planctomycetes bacterium]|nr:fused MFS/spermidine synthase [Planctomycetota bacterium]
MSALRLPLCAALVGFAVMAAELTAVRLLAPHFGDSAYVWTNVIGVILAAMAAGAALGGRLAGREDAARWPLRLLVAGAMLLAGAPWLVGWLGGALLPADLPLDAAMPALIRGSLAASLLAFAPPLFVLSAVSPLLVVLLAARGATLGRAAGDIGAAGTVGSLLGTFLATHWLVPGVGCRWSMAIAAGVLLLAAALSTARTARGVVPGGVLLAALAPWHVGPLRPAPNGVELLAEVESPYQYLQVQRAAAPEEPTRTTLVINEGLDSFHSIAIEGSHFTGGAYYDWQAVAPLLAGDGARPPGLRALSIGDAAGSLRRVYAGCHPGATVDAVDIDAATMQLGDEFFGDDKASGARFALDGRLFLERAVGTWHVIHVDAYAHQVYVPAHLASREFFAAAHEHLEPGGVLACNVGALRLDDPVLDAVAGTVRDVFGNASAMLVPNSRNALLVARRGGTLRCERLAEVGDEPLSAADREHWRYVLGSAATAQWRSPDADAPVLRDDRPQLDELLFRSYVELADPGEPIDCSGRQAAVAAESAAFDARGRGDWPGVLRAVAESLEPTAYLRRLAGDARWHLRQLRSAQAEYRAGIQLVQDEETRRALEGLMQAAAEELSPIASATAIGRRNGWLAMTIALLGVGLAGVALRAARP